MLFPFDIRLHSLFFFTNGHVTNICKRNGAAVILLISLAECITEHCIASLLLQSDNIGLSGYCSPVVVFTMDLINSFL